MRRTLWFAASPLLLCFLALASVQAQGSLLKNQSALDAIVPDFKVNDKEIANWHHQYSSLAIDKNGTVIMAWVDSRSGNHVYAQRFASDGTPLGDGFKVNSDPDDGGNSPVVAVDDSGKFMIAWTDNRNATFYQSDVYAQLYASDGSPIGFNIKVNGDNANAAQSNPTIATGANGEFIIAWWDGRKVFGDVYAQRYDRDGLPIGVNFLINQDGPILDGSTAQGPPSIASDSSGAAIVVFMDKRVDFNYGDIYGQKITSSGTLQSGNYLISRFEILPQVYRQQSPSVSVNDSGEYLVAWYDQRNGYYSVYAKRYHANGTAYGDEFRVDDADSVVFTTRTPCVALKNDGEAIIAWTDFRNGDDDIYAQRFDAAGNAIGSNFRITDASSPSEQSAVALAVAPGGEYLFAWNDYRDGLTSSLYTQRISGDGTPIGSNVAKPLDDASSVNTNQEYPAIATNASGHSVIAWTDERNGPTDPDVYAQRLSPDGTPVGMNFKVNQDTAATIQYAPRVAINDAGQMMFVWRNASGVSFRARWYDANGNPTTADTALGYVFDFALAPTGNNFVLVWGNSGSSSGQLNAILYDPSGTPVGSSFRVDDDPGTTFQGNPSIAVDDSGTMMIAYRSLQTGNNDIYARLFGADGTPEGPSFQVNDDATTRMQVSASVAVTPTGDFVIAWVDLRNNKGEVYAQRYANDGTPIGANFPITDSLAAAYSSAWTTVACDQSGRTVVAWPDNRRGGGGSSGAWANPQNLFGQLLDADGNLTGPNFPFSATVAAAHPGAQSVTVWNGRITATWADIRTDGILGDIWANVLDWNDPLISTAEAGTELPQGFALSQNYPNPFNPSTEIAFSLPGSERVTIEVFNALGQRSATLIDEELPAGRHSLRFNAAHFPSGVYFYRMQAGGFFQVRRMLLLK